MNVLPGAVGVSHLAVYDSAAPDGEHGGSPHMHLACSECYVVQAGRGRVQTFGPEGYRELELNALDVVWFEPGIVHRLVNDGDLQLLVIMQNDGLPEAGDAVFTFPPEVLADPEAYARAATIDGEAAAAARRDLAVRGFEQLVRERDLRAFHASALALVADRLPEWERRWRSGPLAAAQRTGDLLQALMAGDTGPLAEAGLHATHAQDDPRRLGMCGRLATLELPR